MVLKMSEEKEEEGCAFCGCPLQSKEEQERGVCDECDKEGMEYAIAELERDEGDKERADNMMYQ